MELKILIVLVLLLFIIMISIKDLKKKIEKYNKNIKRIKSVTKSLEESEDEIKDFLIRNNIDLKLNKEDQEIVKDIIKENKKINKIIKENESKTLKLINQLEEDYGYRKELLEKLELIKDTKPLYLKQGDSFKEIVNLAEEMEIDPYAEILIWFVIIFLALLMGSIIKFLLKK